MQTALIRRTTMDRLGLLCRNIYENNKITQRELAAAMDISLGTCNHLVKEGLDQELFSFDPVDGSYSLLKGGVDLLRNYRMDSAVILAAGFGSRFVPLTFETPKGLLEVYGERMIERQIKQLHEAGVTDITIVVGYLKEKFEYLIDKFGVKLLYNPEYHNKNTLTTLYRARECFIGRNTYLLSSDNWMRNNMYHTYECGAWYSSVYMKGETSEWCLETSKKGLLTGVKVGGEDSWVMYGPVFFSKEFSEKFFPILEEYYHTPGTEQMYWEQVLADLLNGEVDSHLPGKHHFPVPEMYINRQPDNQVYEFENLEELRLFDERYQNHSDNIAMELISEVLQVPESEITGIKCLKTGMTNKSFLFKVHGKSYICRIPGPGTELLINRKQEKAVYDAVQDYGITEHVVYMNGETGYKISEYYEGARNSDPRDWDDMARCMALVEKLHASKLHVDYSFDIRERIGFYEALCRGYEKKLFEDYPEVKSHMTTLLDRLDRLNRPKVLSHIDSVCDNFLFLPDGDLRLIDWEYSGMCDPLIDVSMCAIYSYYNDFEVEKLIKLYLHREPTSEERFVYYAYIALGGFLWCLWAVYKSSVGEEFGDYTIVMYRYAKRFYKKIITSPEFLGIGDGGTLR